jgi:hypothetical protein
MNLRILPVQQESDKHRGIFTSSRIELGLDRKGTTYTCLRTTRLIYMSDIRKKKIYMSDIESMHAKFTVNFGCSDVYP